MRLQQRLIGEIDLFFRSEVALNADETELLDALASHLASALEGLRAAALEREAWDGQWYRRAWFDDGTPLGSESNDECKIDAIAQSWSVISGAGDEEKRKQALESAYELLVDKEHRILKLLTPPFNSSDLQPGYIKGYLPGIRENGGQYTHAAIWLVMAFAMQQDAERAYELLRYVNPLLHGNTKQEADKYRGEPYVMAGDVYEGEHPGQAGWTWYTGSAGWAYRLIIEYILGMKMENGEVSFGPTAPAAWDSFKVSYKVDGETKTYYSSNAANAYKALKQD